MGPDRCGVSHLLVLWDDSFIKQPEHWLEQRAPLEEKMGLNVNKRGAGSVLPRPHGSPIL